MAYLFEKLSNGRVKFEHGDQTYNFSGDEDLIPDPLNDYLFYIISDNIKVDCDTNLVTSPSSVGREDLMSILASSFFTNAGGNTGSTPTGVATEATLSSLLTEQEGTNSKLDTSNTELQAVNSKLESANAKADDTNDKLDASAIKEEAIIDKLAVLESVAIWDDIKGQPLTAFVRDMQTSGTVPYALIGVRLAANATGRAKLSLVSVYLETNDDYSIFIGSYNSFGEAETNINGQTISWVDKNTELQVAEFDNSPAQTFSTEPEYLLYLNSRDVNNISEKAQIIIEPGKEYIIGIRPQQTGSDSYASINMRYYAE